MTRLPASVASKKPARMAESVPPVYRDEQPREAESKSAPGRCTTDLFEAKTERLKKLRTDRPSPATARSILGLACFQDFFGKQIRVDDSNHAALFVHDRESEEFVKHEELARVEHRCLRRNSHDAPNHHFAQCGLQWRGQQAPGRHDAHESLLFIDRVEINYALTNALAPDPLQRFANRHVRVQQRKIFPRMLEDRRTKIGNAVGKIHLATR